MRAENFHSSRTVSIGAGAIILPAVRIGAWAVGTRDVRPGSLVKGMPAKMDGHATVSAI